MKTLYNLTYDEEFYVSTLHPDRLPEDDFSLIEIEYNDETVRSIKGLYCYDGKQESLVLTDLEIMGYLKNLKDFECEIEFQGDPDIENKKEKVFIVLVCSYLIYIAFIKDDLSLELLNRETFKEFVTCSRKNEIVGSWISQVSYLDRNYGYLFPDEKKDDEIIDEDVNERICEINDVNEVNEVNEIDENKTEKELIHENKNLEEIITELAKKHVKEYAKIYVRGFMKEYFDKKVEEAVNEGIKKINAEADSISKEVKEFKRKLLKDISKKN